MLSYANQRMLAVAVAVLLAGVAVVQVADPADFGLTPVMVRWLGVIGAMLGVLSSFLPSVRGMSTNPDFLANRVSELPPSDRVQVVREVQERAGQPVPTAAEIADELERRRRERVEARLREVSNDG